MLDLTPAWTPETEFIKKTHLAQFMAQLSISEIAEFHAWTVKNYSEFWQQMIDKLNIVLQKPYEKICDVSAGVEHPQWLAGAKLNIVESCFTAPPSHPAVLFYDENNQLQKLSYGKLHALVNRIANSLVNAGFSPGDAIAIDMPMTVNAIAIYLGIIKMGGVVVSIADSFSKDEIKIRLRIANAKGIFTQDIILRDNKKLPLYEKIIAADAPKAIVLPCEKAISLSLRPQDLSWSTFLVANDQFQAHSCNPMAHCNILFSSGTTGEPKAIPWNHTTPIKTASDAYLHQNIGTDDILAWPTNLGWMMGPWLIFAALINRATIAIYDGAPTNRAFGKFIQDAKVTMLGVVPTLVRNWQQSQCMEGLNWQSIKLFSSTGECSNPDDMRYLMSLAGTKPIIEYCGGTEIGGAYITSTLIENNYPSVCTTPAMGSHFILIDEAGKIATQGEVALVPPTMGLSTELLNANHHQIYFANMPASSEGTLRRHGDQLRRLPNGYYCILGRMDDTMNLSAIKISSVEIERCLLGIEDIIETAAIGVTDNNSHGPSRLVIYVATHQHLNKEHVKKQMQERINLQLNPLFKIYDIVFIKELPKTASNKIMRRLLRKEYEEKIR